MAVDNLVEGRYDTCMETPSRSIERTLLVVVVALLVAGCFVVLRPFLSALMWAIILCFATWPVYIRLERLVGGRRGLAALLMTLIVAVVLLAPFAVIGLGLAENVKGFASSAQRHLADGLPPPPEWLGRLPLVGASASGYWQSLASDHAKLRAELNRIIEPGTGWLLAGAVALLRGLAELAISVLIAFFLYRDGLAAAARLTAAIERLAGDEARRLLDLAAATIRGVVYGTIGTALVQATITGIGLAVAGVPRAGLLTLLAFFFSILPLGPVLVWVPAMIWLFYEGRIGWGIFMLAWGCFVSTIDNVIKPALIGHASPIPFLLILLGVLGGASAFGFIGVFIGPTLLAVGFRLLEQWNAGRRPNESPQRLPC